ncbi:FeoA family protein [Absiella sp. AM29-15]|jgi:Fe2+ transport system protein FeoA|nr:FeoA domain-containing protein [Absiella sp. AM29-15]
MVIKMNASEMREQQLCEVIRVHMEEADTKRLFYLGIYEGAIIRLIQKAPLQDPYLFYVQGTHLILRKQDAQRIEVKCL